MPYLKLFTLALLTAFVLTPPVRRLALSVGAVDRPAARKVHTEPKPYLGGVAIYLAFFAAMAWSVGFGSRTMQGILIGATLILLIGVVDDLRSLRPAVKFAGQILAAVVLVWFDVKIEWLTNPFGGMIILPSWLVPVLTVFWIVAVINVVNLIDGLDGLAAGISTIAAVTLLMAALMAGQHTVVLMTAALAGAALGFLPHNFNPAKIFMGDGGSMFLGFLLAAVSVEGTLKSAATAALVIPVLALGLPMFDTALAIVRRTANGRPFHEADRGHLHHRLMQMGLSHRDTVLVMWVVSGWLGISAIALMAIGLVPALVLLLFVGVSLIFAAKKVGILDVREKNIRN